MKETIDVLSRSLRIIQYAHGHRAASDDVLLAWAALRARPKARRILDLGTGKGTVAFLLLRRIPGAVAVGIEAHEPHHHLAVRNAVLNGLTARYEARLADLRGPGVIGAQESFDLICGAPPYVPVGKGIMPTDAGRAAGRFELRGGVEAYVQVAALHLGTGGRLVLLMDDRGRERAESALHDAGLFVCREVAVRPRPGRAPKYWLIESSDAIPGALAQEQLCMRLDQGKQWSPAYAAIRETLELPCDPSHKDGN